MTRLADLEGLKRCKKSCPFCLGTGKVKDGDGGEKECSRAASPMVYYCSGTGCRCWRSTLDRLIEESKKPDWHREPCSECGRKMFVWVYGSCIMTEDFEMVYDPEADPDVELVDDIDDDQPED